MVRCTKESWEGERGYITILIERIGFISNSFALNRPCFKIILYTEILTKALVLKRRKKDIGNIFFRHE